MGSRVWDPGILGSGILGVMDPWVRDPGSRVLGPGSWIPDPGRTARRAVLWSLDPSAIQTPSREQPAGAVRRLAGLVVTGDGAATRPPRPRGRGGLPEPEPHDVRGLSPRTPLLRTPVPPWLGCGLVYPGWRVVGGVPGGYTTHHHTTRVHLRPSRPPATTGGRRLPCFPRRGSTELLARTRAAKGSAVKVLVDGMSSTRACARVSFMRLLSTSRRSRDVT